MSWTEESKPLKATVENVTLEKRDSITYIKVDLFFEELKAIIADIPTSLRFDNDADAVEFAMKLSGASGTVYDGVISLNLPDRVVKFRLNP